LFLNIKFLTYTAVLLAVALVFQMGGFPQPVTGPLVNMVLYIAVLFVGTISGVVVGIFTPIIAYIRGILPPPLMPIIPFIALGNAVLCILFGMFKDKTYVGALISASMVKFLILFLAVKFLVDIPEAAAQMMSFPQLLTALGGGFLAFLVYRALVAAGVDDSMFKDE